ncbi:glycosyl transferase [Desulfosporosinus orientis DSM 765]|uniref:Glycosyl transferase n=1 Tax=Desulfosporosinus orientis (strain ATCC 19365 / DSM 765 / NCIMB 8382 / VKM B-1628 / Singapore I) TaxID=768706 RepID=G7W537_DESOD|nr:glycosyltransferase family 2 protein [Desulfosporosinus orientis]AET66053.1 glycosyl transferase [Desulfosporosinus orientis DSM 765]
MVSKKITVSLCIIVKNEEKTISRCLDSVKDICDEIIIVDTGSSDQTKEIVKKYPVKILDFAWIDDFAAARNFAFSQATMDYILWLDADDVLRIEDQEKILKLMKNLDPYVDAVSMLYHYAFDQHGNVSFSFRRNRLVKRDKNFRWVGAVHEYLEVSGNILNSDICVTHKRMQGHSSDRNLKIFERRREKGESFSPRDLYYYGNELFDHRLYSRAVEVYQEFLQTGQGWVEDEISACGKLADCFKELGETEKQLEYCYKSFNYASPRAEFCCRLGFYFLNAKQYEQGAFWYKLAARLEKPIGNSGFMIEACWTWLPHLQLCVCYDRLGKHELAYEHNEIAREYSPENAQVLYNKKYFEEVLGIGTKKQEIGQV